MSDLVKRLRDSVLEVAEVVSMDKLRQLNSSAIEAADRIEELELAVTQLQAEVYKANRRAELADEWRDHDKERAEKAEKEVERLTLFNNECRRSLSYVAEQRDTSWNDAISAAAKECGHHLSTESDVFLSNDIASRIRALKRSTQ